MLLITAGCLTAWVYNNLRPKPKYAVLLLNNGSLKAEAIISLREVCQQLQRRVPSYIEIVPVGARHSDKVPHSQLDDEPGLTLTRAVPALLARGIRNFIVLPMFFGPSDTIEKFVPNQMKQLTEGYEVSVAHCKCLVDVKSDDSRVARAIADRTRERLRELPPHSANVVLVDHGSPKKAVNDVRQHLTKQLRAILDESEAKIVTCASMDRRVGEKYDFNEPMLEGICDAIPKLKSTPGFVAALAFLFPGRHAGPNGDLVQILEYVQAEHNVRGLMTRLIQNHPLVLDVLLDRLSDKLIELENQSHSSHVQGSHSDKPGAHKGHSIHAHATH